MSEKNKKMTANFTLGELTYSRTAISNNIRNIPNAEQIKNLQRLCETVLQPIRDEFGYVIIISGFRNAELNSLVGGSPTSDHLHGLAADFVCPDSDMKKIAIWICDYLDFHQLIDSIDERGFIHISIHGKKHRETLVESKKKYHKIAFEDYYNTIKLKTIG